MNNIDSHLSELNKTDRESEYLKVATYNGKEEIVRQWQEEDESMGLQSSNDADEQSFPEFNPHDFGNAKNPTSFWGTFLHLVIIGTSPTLLNIPTTFIDVGYVVGFTGALFIVIFYAYLMHKLILSEYILCKQLRIPRLTYADLIYHSFAEGPQCIRRFAGYARQVLYVDIACIWAGGNAIYVLLVSENVKYVYDHIYGTDVSIRTVMVYVSVPLVLLCWSPNLRLLTICSVFANVINTFSIVTILYTAGQNFPSLSERNPFCDDITQLPLFVGTIFVTINATGIIMPLKNEMKNPRKFSSKTGVINLSFMIISLLYSFFGLICYLKYGKETKGNVMLNMPDNYFTMGVIGLYAVGVICYFPIVSYVSYDIFWNNIMKPKIKKSSARKVMSYIARTLFGMSSIVFAFVMPNIALFLSLTGTFGTSLDSIVFPALIELLLTAGGQHSMKCWQVGRNVVIILLGIVLMVFGVANSVSSVIEFYNQT